MRLTKGTDYGVRSVIYMAKQPPRTVSLVADIARHEGIPESYLAKILQDLTKEGILRSHRGAKGGFSLARPPEEITLREVIEAIEGTIALARCLNPWETCERQATCAVYPLLLQAQENLLALLGSRTLADIASTELALESTPEIE